MRSRANSWVLCLGCVRAQPKWVVILGCAIEAECSCFLRSTRSFWIKSKLWRTVKQKISFPPPSGIKPVWRILWSSHPVLPSGMWQLWQMRWKKTWKTLGKSREWTAKAVPANGLSWIREALWYIYSTRKQGWSMIWKNCGAFARFRLNRKSFRLNRDTRNLGLTEPDSDWTCFNRFFPFKTSSYEKFSSFYAFLVLIRKLSSE